LDHHEPDAPQAPPPSPPVAPEAFQLYVEILHGGARGQDITAHLERLAALLTSELERLEGDARRSAEALPALAIAKRVSYELLHHLLRVTELGAARQAIAVLLGRTSVYELVPHPRYRITQDWFSNNVPRWQTALAELAGRPGVRCLEIGSFEGMSACWLLENVLTHETSRITCIDPFDAPGQLQAERHFDHNVQQTGAAHKLTKLKGYSGQVLPLLAGSRFELVYIDGSHQPADALADALLTWPLLCRGGIAIFDDYAIGGSYPKEIAPAIDPKPGIDAFLGFARGEYAVVSQDYQLIVRKL
jgi:predicted O-methyltransferase YrrM